MIRQGSLSMAVLLACAGAVFAQGPAGRPQLGVELGGVAVERVDSGSVADKGGIKAGDVIVVLGERTMAGVEDARAFLEGLSGGEIVVAKVLRGGEDVALTLQFPGELADVRLGVAPADGVPVVGVVPGSVAEKAGIRRGDVIVVFGGDKVASFDELRRNVQQASGKESVTVLRGGSRQELTADFGATGPRAGRRRGESPFGELFGGGGLESMRMLMEVGSIRDRVAEALQLLQQGQDAQAVDRAVGILKDVRRQLSEIAEGVESLRGMAESLMEGFGEVEMPPMPELDSLNERLQELLGEGVDVSKIREILRREFGVQIEIEEEVIEEPETQETRPTTRPSTRGGR